VMRKKTLLAFDELERARDVSVQHLGRLQYAVGNEGIAAGNTRLPVR
jgi:hypothetical protein